MLTETRPTSWPRSERERNPFLSARIAKIRDYARPKNTPSRMALAKMQDPSLCAHDNDRKPLRARNSELADFSITGDFGQALSNG